MAKLLKSAVNRKLLEIIDHHGRVSRYVSDAASKEGLVKKSVNLDEPKTKDIGGKVQVRASIPKHLSNEVRIANMRNLLVGKEALFPPSMRDDEAQVPFEEVPGPKLLKHIANALTVIPVIGSHVVTSTIRYMIGSQLSWGYNSFLFRYLLDEYGPIVRLQGPFGGSMVILTRAEDAAAVFSNEGVYPMRSNLDCIEQYRLKYRKYKNAGPFLMQGHEWAKMRELVERPLKSTVSFQFAQVSIACDEFVARIRDLRNAQEEVPSGFREEVCKWAMECICSVMLGKNVSFINADPDDDSEQNRFMEAFHGATEAVRRCETGMHVWKLVETPAWKKLVRNCDVIDGTLARYISEVEVEENANSEEEAPLVQLLLSHKKISPEEVLTVFLDMVLIGVNAVSHSLIFLLYHLARYPKCQRALLKEVKDLPDKYTRHDVERSSYLRACIKESLRLKPPIPFISRVLPKDIVVHNYQVPKGTVVLLATYLSSVREENFDDASKFIPERWLSSDMHHDAALATIPFGYGPRACIAKDLAETQLSLMVIKILKQFRVEYHYGNVNSTNKMIASPDRDVKFRFVSRFHN